MPNSIIWFYPSSSINEPFRLIDCSGDIQQCLQNNGVNENDNNYLSMFNLLNSAGIQQSYLLAKAQTTESWEPLVRSNSPGLQCVNWYGTSINYRQSITYFLEKLENNVYKMDFFRFLLVASIFSNYDIVQIFNDIKSTSTLQLSIGNVNITINNLLHNGHFVSNEYFFLLAFNSIMLILSIDYLLVFLKTDTISDFLDNIGSNVPYTINDSDYSWSLDLSYIENLYNNNLPDAPNGVLTRILSEILRPVDNNLPLPSSLIMTTDNNTYEFPDLVATDFTLNSTYNFLPILRNLAHNPNNEIEVKAHPMLNRFIQSWNAFIYRDTDPIARTELRLNVITGYQDDPSNSYRFISHSIDLTDPNNNTQVNPLITEPFYGGTTGWDMANANFLFEFTYDAQTDAFTVSPVVSPQDRFTQYNELAANASIIQGYWTGSTTASPNSINKLAINVIGYDFNNLSSYLPTGPGPKVIIFRPLPNLDLDYLINNLNNMVNNRPLYYIVYLGASRDVIVSSKVLYAGDQVVNVPGQNINIPMGVRYVHNLSLMSSYAA